MLQLTKEEGRHGTKYPVEDCLHVKSTVGVETNAGVTSYSEGDVLHDHNKGPVVHLPNCDTLWRTVFHITGDEDRPLQGAGPPWPVRPPCADVPPKDEEYRAVVETMHR